MAGVEDLKNFEVQLVDQGIDHVLESSIEEQEEEAELVVGSSD